ncbi:MAG: LpqM protein [uncultured Quadrisphaera sp.]|uniref:LpqM protein n=1 Tax=uncultured Quadrisphaera sp. TaxID=904978 RepID=A0A6J4NY02_9ACTN|nr:MAG: LpqM protein [uncultured Quadrisphaera sp.]
MLAATAALTSVLVTSPAASAAPGSPAGAAAPTAPASASSPLMGPVGDAGSGGVAGEVTDEELLDDLATAVAVTDAYWARHLPADLGQPYDPPGLASGADGVPGLYDGTVDALACHGEVLPVGNAVYCGGPDDDWIAADLALLRAAQDLGDAFVYVVLAHEWGHAVQARLPQEAHWAAYELQADCLAGAALQGAADEGALVVDPTDPQEVLDSYAALDGTPWGDGGTHGSAQERYAAFERGVVGGPVGCLPV